MLTSCDGFLDEYSQDLSRVRTADDLNELLMGDCTLPLGLFSVDNSYYQYDNPNYAVLHFMSDELQENLTITSNDNDGPYFRETIYPYFTWQQECSVDYQGKTTLDGEEERYWALAYERLNNCNVVIEAGEALDCPEDDDENLRQQVLGECHFLRANYYFVLANLYGRAYHPQTASQDPCVPIKVSSKIEDIDYQRSSVSEVYAQILSDLNAAERYLSDKPAPKNIWHAGLTAVYIFRSRVHLFMQQWQEARQYALAALQQNSTLLDLRGFSTAVSSFPISDTNPEVVYSNGATCFGNLVFNAPSRRSSSGSASGPVYCISDHLAGLYTDDDSRKVTYITTRADLSKHTYTYHKIDNSTASWGKYKSVSDVFSLRTAESYLILAEAESQLGNAQEACRWLNALRDKRLTEQVDTMLSGEPLVRFIREERERELCLEGHRWFDLRRYGADPRYPYQTAIEHTMTWFRWQGSSQVRSYTNYYRLEPGDDAYTLNIPKSVREFQVTIGANPRPDRQPFNTVNY